MVNPTFENERSEEAVSGWNRQVLGSQVVQQWKL